VRGAPSAVVRNRFKRIARELFRHQKEQLGAFDFNVVVSLKGPVEPREFQKYRETIEKEFTI
jgi:ribonuclease P protein component